MKEYFSIYQVKPTLTRDLAFRRYEEVQNSVDVLNYSLLYTAERGEMNLDDIFETFNVAIPQDFTGHSLSVSDVIVFWNEGTDDTMAFFIDIFGFVRIPDFFAGERRKRK